MYCKKCGTQLPDDAQFCIKCGEAQRENIIREEPILETCEITLESFPPTIFRWDLTWQYVASAYNPNGKYCAGKSKTWRGGSSDKVGKTILDEFEDQLLKVGWVFRESYGTRNIQKLFERRKK